MSKLTVTDPKNLTLEESQELISEKCDEIKAILLAKNRKYGNSALNPKGIFSKGQTAEQKIGVRIDDKLSRIENRQNDEDEDPELDLVGYGILKMIARDLGI